MAKNIVFSILCLLPFLGFTQLPNTEIYLFDMKVKKDKIILSHPQNITHHKGYDNQPFFHPTKPIVYYTSEVDSNNTDIKYYNYKTKKTEQFTHTNKFREYSPTLTPDGKYISCVIQYPDERQDLCKYPIDKTTDSSIVLVNTLKVGYHCWIDQTNVLMFILGDSTHDLHLYNCVSKKDTIFARKIGRALHKIPNEIAMSFVDKSDDSTWIIKKLYLPTRSVSNISTTLKNNEDLLWLEDGRILMSDGKYIYCYNPENKSIFTLTMEGGRSMLNKLTRMVVNVKNNKIAVVVSE